MCIVSYELRSLAIERECEKSCDAISIGTNSDRLDLGDTIIDRSCQLLNLISSHVQVPFKFILLHRIAAIAIYNWLPRHWQWHPKVDRIIFVVGNAYILTNWGIWLNLWHGWYHRWGNSKTQKNCMPTHGSSKSDHAVGIKCWMPLDLYPLYSQRCPFVRPPNLLGKREYPSVTSCPSNLTWVSILRVRPKAVWWTLKYPVAVKPAFYFISKLNCKIMRCG